MATDSPSLPPALDDARKQAGRFWQARAPRERQLIIVMTVSVTVLLVWLVLIQPALRTLAGKPAESDLEPMLQAAAAAWPNERPPVENLRYEPGKLTIAASGWTDAQIEQFRGVLQPAGFQVNASEGRIVVTRARSAA